MRGADLFADLRHDLPALRARTVLDVGAHEGESTMAYLTAFPDAEVHAFEPIAETFATLSGRLAGEARVRCHRLALGDRAGEGRMTVVGEDTTLSSLSPSPRVASAPEAQLETVAVDTLDRFAAGNGIERVDYLKIDAEGHDLRVLEGAERLLASAAVSALEVEAAMNRDNDTHVPLGILQPHLEERGYRLFGLYQQTHEWPSERPHLRRANAVFLSPGLIAEQTERLASTGHGGHRGEAERASSC